MKMATLVLNSPSTTQVNFKPLISKYLSPCLKKSHNNVLMAKKHTEIGPCYSKSTTQNVDLERNENEGGIGIVSFLREKELLVTGATGFLAKGSVLIEKILREAPDVSKIYLVIRANNDAAAIKRLESEIMDDELFKLLQGKYGALYKTFMRSKLVPVIGNICDSNLGMDEDMSRHVASKVDVIVNCSANTTFDARYDVALKTNTHGTRNILSFAKGCKQLELFLHVSTVYAHGERDGKIMESPFRMGDCIAKQKHSLHLTLDVEAELHQFAYLNKNSSTRKMIELGMTRAKKFGWHNTYEFTKAMGEMMIDSLRGDIPVVIVRPSCIESTLRDPFPGWIQGNRLMDPMLMKYGKGNITGFVGDPNVALDVIPGDMVVNTILAAIARHASSKHELGCDNDINVYQIGSSEANPLLFGDLYRMFYEHFALYPYVDPISGHPIKVLPFQIFKSLQHFSSAIQQEAIQKTMASSITTNDSNLEKSLKRSAIKLGRLANIYEPYMYYNGRFDISNTEKLAKYMSDEEKEKFSLDVRGINWEHYIKHVHIPGFSRHVVMKVKY